MRDPQTIYKRLFELTHQLERYDPFAIKSQAEYMREIVSILTEILLLIGKQ